MSEMLSIKNREKTNYRLLHKLVAQVKKGSHLDKHELVHHVDGDKTNNHPDNLFICESKAHHQDVHTQLERLSMSLVKAGIIQFNHETGEYHLPHLKEILNEYSVNSEETYVLEIDSLGNMAILSQAEQFRKVQRLSIYRVEFERTRSAENPNWKTEGLRYSLIL